MVHKFIKNLFWLFQNGLKILIAACDTSAIEQLSVALGKNSMLMWIWKRCWVSKGLLRWRHLLLAYIFTFLAKTNKGGTYANNEPIMRVLAKVLRTDLNI
jgi:hypothetical protein